MRYPRDPTEHYDVYFSQGNGENKALGNIKYRDLINEKYKSFHSTNCKLRKDIIQNDIIRTLEKVWGAKFYAPYYDKSTCSCPMVWRELEREKVLKKVRQALIDKNKQKNKKGGRRGGRGNQQQQHDDDVSGTNHPDKRHSMMMMMSAGLSSISRNLLKQASLMSLGSWRGNNENTTTSEYDDDMDESMQSIHGMMFEQDVYFSTRGDENLVLDDDDEDSCPLGNKRYQELRSSYTANDSFNSASCIQRKMIAREIVTKMENLGSSFYSDEDEEDHSKMAGVFDQNDLHQKKCWKILDREAAVEKVYQDLNGGAGPTSISDRFENVFGGGGDMQEEFLLNNSNNAVRHDHDRHPRPSFTSIETAPFITSSSTNCYQSSSSWHTPRPQQQQHHQQEYRHQQHHQYHHHPPHHHQHQYQHRHEQNRHHYTTTPLLAINSSESSYSTPTATMNAETFKVGARPPQITTPTPTTTSFVHSLHGGDYYHEQEQAYYNSFQNTNAGGGGISNEGTNDDHAQALMNPNTTAQV